MKKLIFILTFLVFSLTHNFGQQIRLVADPLPDQDDLEYGVEGVFDNTMVFAANKRFQFDRVMFLSDGTAANTRQTEITPDNVINYRMKGGYIVGDYYYFYQHYLGNDHIIIYRIHRQTLQMSQFKSFSLYYGRFKGLELYKNKFYILDGRSVSSIDIETGVENPRFIELGFYSTSGIKAFKDKLYILGDMDNDDYGLYQFDGDPTKIIKLKTLRKFENISDQIANWYIHKDKMYFGLYFRTDEPGGIYYTDGTSAGTGLLAEVSPETISGQVPFQFAPLNGKFVFTAQPHGTANTNTVLYISDGTPAGTTVIEPDLDLSQMRSRMQSLDNKVYFNPGSNLYETDGTKAGTKKTFDQEINNFISYNDSIYYVDNLFKLHAYKNGSAIPKLYNGEAISIYSALTPAGNNLFFAANYQSNTQLFTLIGNPTSKINKVPQVDYLTLSPNPASTYFELPEQSGLTKFNVLTIEGGLIYSGKTENGKGDISTLPAGNYIIRFNDTRSGKVFISRLTKN